MSNIIENYADLVGNTPLFHAKNIEKNFGLKFRLLLKLELMNPAHSVKDRTALNMIVEAEKKGLLKKGSTIIEPTSGNTGIGLASIAISRGYNVILTMPETMSLERRQMLLAYGAKLELTEGSKGMKGAIERANEITETIPNSLIIGQFDNPANPQAHFNTTGPEIWSQTDGTIDCFLAGVGTGGTITGTSKYLKQKNPNIKIIAVEPENSSVLSGNPAGRHAIQGIGAGFVPKVLDTGIYDEIIIISDEEAKLMTRAILKNEALLCGISSGAALAACLKLKNRVEFFNKTIVCILPDSGERYISTGIFGGEQ